MKALWSLWMHKDTGTVPISFEEEARQKRNIINCQDSTVYQNSNTKCTKDYKNIDCS